MIEKTTLTAMQKYTKISKKVIVVFAFTVLGHFSLISQSYDLTGDWTGYVTQENMSDMKLSFYEFGVNISAKENETFEGKSYIAIEGDNLSVMGEMRFVAQWKNQVLEYKEVSIIQQKVPLYLKWCLKSCRFELKEKKDSLVLEGKWTGKSGSSTCNPGFIRISKPYRMPSPAQYDLSQEKNKPILPEQVKIGNKFEFSAIQFEPSKSYLLTSSYETLDALADWIKKHPQHVIEIAGHTDKGKDYQYNMELSKARAEAVKEYLVKRGVNPNKLRAKGYGSTKPIADNETVEGRKLNRRVEFIILE